MIPSGNAENRYKPSKQIIFNTLMLQSDLCKYSDAYVVVKGTIAAADPNHNAYDKELAFTNNALLISCISKINNSLIDNAEELDIVMGMYILIEYNKNYSNTKFVELLPRLTKCWCSIPTNATFRKTDTKFYASVFTLSTEDDNKFLEQFKTRFRRTIKLNKYRSQISNQTKTFKLFDWSDI